jgi:NAD(P)-dependent dehydrogenase (short-subunit alcohol dehydrogenase family)
MAERPVALVTGASRGAGRGIAHVLGERGYVVYVSGRSVRGLPTVEDMPGTIDDTAEEVSARGGIGIPVRCDHTVDAEVKALFARVRAEHGHLDLLVSNAWGGYEYYDSASFTRPLWELPLALWDRMIIAGLRAQIVTCKFGIPLLLGRSPNDGPGLVVSTIAWDHDKYLGGYYDIAKHAIARMILGLGIELRRHNVAAIAVAPGFMRTERVLAAPARDWPKGEKDLSITESPEYVGRVIAALAADAGVMSRSGKAFRAGELAREYGITDVDGRFIEPFEL